MRVLYLHGFASGPRSTKAVRLVDALAPAGISLEVPDLNLPDFEHLRIGRMVDHVVDLVKGEPAVIVGSSLGALVALHAAAREASVKALVLVAPALSPDARWKAWIGADGIEKWRREGKRNFYNFVTSNERPIDFGFFEDVIRFAKPPALRVPASVIHGKRDEAVPFAVSEELARAYPSLVKLQLVDDDHSLLGHVDLIAQEVVAAAQAAVKRAS
jgi:pimeloyl-ACP methyl ester carboxylesterase